MSAGSGPSANLSLSVNVEGLLTNDLHPEDAFYFLMLFSASAQEWSPV